MKYRLLIAAAVCTSLAGWFLIWRLPRASHAAAERTSLRFICFTNLADAQEPTDPFLRDLFGTALQTWKAGGANVALFALTNRENYRIVVYPAFGRLLAREGNPPPVTTFFLPCTNLGAFCLAPGQGIVLRAAFPQRAAPWKMGLAYKRDTTEHNFLDVVRGVAWALSRPKATRKSYVETEWIENLPSRQTGRAEQHHPADASQPSGSVPVWKPSAAGSDG